MAMIVRPSEVFAVRTMRSTARGSAGDGWAAGVTRSYTAHSMVIPTGGIPCDVKRQTRIYRRTLRFAMPNSSGVRVPLSSSAFRAWS